MRKVYPRVPKGMGHIKYLGKGRTNPYAVLPPVYKDGGYEYKKALCYVDNWYVAFAVLNSYMAGTYHPGDEVDISRRMKGVPEWQVSDVVKKIIQDYQIAMGSPVVKGHKFKSVYDDFMEYRFGEYAPADFSKATHTMYKSDIKRWESLFNKDIESITVDDLQKEVNKLAEKYASGTIRTSLAICSSVFSFAIDRGYVSRSPVSSVRIPKKAKPTEHGQAYTDEDLNKIWAEALKGNEVAIFILEQTYSGFRLGAMYDLDIDLERKTLYGGVKTGKRTIPIHPLVLDFFTAHPDPPYSTAIINPKIQKLCVKMGIDEDHTSHSARHTFKRLCDKFNVHPVAARLMMGHSLGKDVHDKTYTHWDIEDLRKELEKIVWNGTNKDSIHS